MSKVRTSAAPETMEFVITERLFSDLGLIYTQQMRHRKLHRQQFGS